MKLYNRDLELIENREREKRVTELAEKNISFLVENYGINENVLRKRFEKMALVERVGKTHFAVQNGEKHEIQSNAPASFCAKKNMDFDGEKWTFENGLYTSDNNSNHTITHELFHILSENTEMNYNEKGIGYDKRGVSITGYNKDDDDDDDKDLGIKANGLNEGITEMLAMQVDGMYTPQVYTPQVYLAQILVNSQENSLIEAYFSNDIIKFQNFLDEFNKRQSIISSDKLVTLSMNSCEDMNIDILKGCLQYSLSFCKNIEQLKEERNRLLPVFKSMKNNWVMEYSEENFDVKNFFIEIMNEKKREIQEQSIENEIGKATIHTDTQKKDEAQEQIKHDIQKMQEKNKNR